VTTIELAGVKKNYLSTNLLAFIFGFCVMDKHNNGKLAILWYYLKNKYVYICYLIYAGVTLLISLWCDHFGTLWQTT
jgi:hypothetical protein